MRNIKIVVEYEGTRYLGWQRQPQGMTIQQALEEALEKAIGVMPRVTGASRTDAGVHARGQTANFRTESLLPPARIRGALNALLPRDIVVLSAEDVPDDFDSRFSAKSKLYHYHVWNHPVRPAMFRHFMWHVRWAADVNLMNRAAAALVGRHDFAAFESSNAQSETTVRTVTRAQWIGAGAQLVFAIEADAFLYNMVRAIVGTLIDVGRGRLLPEEMARIIESCDRGRAGRTAPGQGLCLMEVRYAEPTIIEMSPDDGRCVSEHQTP